MFLSLCFFPHCAFFLQDFSSILIQDDIASCSSPVSSKTIFGAVLDDGLVSRSGFGSVINNALNAYLIANIAEPRRSFQLINADWSYRSFSSLFRNAPCRIFLDHPRHSLRLIEEVEEFVLTVNSSSGRISIVGPEVSAYNYMTRNFQIVRKIISGIAEDHGKHLVFQTKRAALKLIWNPIDSVRNLTDILRASLGSYVAVHIRRGDKVAYGEAEAIGVEKYQQAVMDYCVRAVKCPETVFVMSDDPTAVSELRGMLMNFTVVDEEQLFSKAKDVVDGIVEEREGSDEGKRLDARKTVQLVVGLTIAARAEHVVCTFSSNLCRLIALLNGDLRCCTSLDVEWHPM